MSDTLYIFISVAWKNKKKKKEDSDFVGRLWNVIDVKIDFKEEKAKEKGIRFLPISFYYR